MYAAIVGHAPVRGTRRRVAPTPSRTGRGEGMPISGRSRVEAQAELAKEHREALPVSARQTVEDVLLDVDEPGDGSIHSQAPLVGERDQHAAAVDRVGAAVHE